MVSLLNVHLPSMMQVQRAEGGQVLPWQTGSLLSGKLMMPSDGLGAMLVLGSYRVRVEVPPNTPMGHIWLQLMQREMPGQFRMLTQQQAIALLSEMLQSQTDKSSQHHKDTGQKPAVAEQQTWAKMHSDSFPFTIEAQGHRLFLWDKEKGSPQGLIQEESNADSFKLFGRVDLPTLGGVVFSLEGKNDVWKFDVHLADIQLKHVVEESLLSWFEMQGKRLPVLLQGVVSDTVQAGFGDMLNREA